MDIMIKLTIPNYIYQFYEQASHHIADGTAAQIMSDTLAAYTGMISNDIAKQLEKDIENNPSGAGAP